METYHDYRVNRHVLNYIPLLWLEPKGARRSEAVIWLPGLGGSKETSIPFLRELAANGFVAISFDAYQQGDRLPEEEQAFRAKLDRNKRQYFWPMLALTADEYPRVMDWAIAELGVSPRFLAGGSSMGGDIALAAAGLDRRIAGVAAILSTPDWLRPGSDEAPCAPDRYAWNCYDRCNPMTNLHRYAHKPYLSFRNGSQDGHVPPHGARRFKELLANTYADCPERFEIAEYETGHQFVPEMHEESLRWFKTISDGLLGG